MKKLVAGGVAVVVAGALAVPALAATKSVQVKDNKFVAKSITVKKGAQVQAGDILARSHVIGGRRGIAVGRRRRRRRRRVGEQQRQADRHRGRHGGGYKRGNDYGRQRHRLARIAHQMDNVAGGERPFQIGRVVDFDAFAVVVVPHARADAVGIVGAQPVERHRARLHRHDNVGARVERVGLVDQRRQRNHLHPTFANRNFSRGSHTVPTRRRACSTRPAIDRPT